MIRWTRSRACAIVAATATAAAMCVGVAGSVGAADGALVPAAEWRPFPADTVGHGFVAVDEAARVGFAFSGTLDNGEWTRAQALDLRTGRAVSAVTPLPVLSKRAPLLVDPKRGFAVYAETHAPNRPGPFASHLVGIALRGKEIKVVFRVPSPLGQLRIAGMTYDATGRDLYLLGSLDGAGQSAVKGSSLVQVQRLSVDELARGRMAARWSAPYSFPAGACPTLIETAQPAGILVAGDRLWVGCRGPSNGFTGTFGQNAVGTHASIVQVAGVGERISASPAVTQFRTPGNFTLAGESFADPRTRRLVIVESSGYIGLRVFDAEHGRYVGRINAGQQALYGGVVDRVSSRVYFSSFDPDVGVGYGDLAALVPTQGERLPEPYAAYLGRGTQRRLSFDSATRRLFVPLRRQNDLGQDVETILVMADKSAPYETPEAIDHSAGAIDAVDRAGVTESSIAAIARAYGADYQLIGGTAHLAQNVTGVDTRGIARPGTRHLRQAYVRSASLTGDGAVAYSTTAEEDATTDADRHAATAPSPAPSSATAGSRFAPVAECSDYGAGRTEAVVPAARSACDLKGETVTGTGEFQADDGVMITFPPAQHQAPVRAPVQIGRATTEVRHQRAPGRGPLVTTVTTTARNVAIGDVASFGNVTQAVTLRAHGRTGTARVERTWSISNVVVGGRDVCGAQCSPQAVQREVNAALAGRGGIQFPAPVMFAATRGTYAELTQDPWYHAERVLDYDKANDDFVVPVMSIEYRMDSTSKSRLVVDVAGVAASASYRVYPLGDDGDSDGGDLDGDDDDGGLLRPVPNPTITLGETVSPVESPRAVPRAPLAAGEQRAVLDGIAERVGLTLRSLREAVPMLMIWALLGVPAYLSARRRLLLELPMLTRDGDMP